MKFWLGGVVVSLLNGIGLYEGRKEGRFFLHGMRLRIRQNYDDRNMSPFLFVCRGVGGS